MTSFIFSASENLFRWLMEKFVLKEAVTKADSGRKLLKINQQDVNIQNPADHINVGSASKLHIAK